MRTFHRLLAAISMAVVLSLAGNAAAQTAAAQARDSLNAGLRAARSVQYDTAIEAFKKAIALDPNLIDAELAMANAYTALVVQGSSPSPQVRQERAASAIAGFERVLARVPDNVDAVAGLGRVHQAISELQKAREYYLRTARMAPSTAAPFFAIGLVDWNLVSGGNIPASERIQLVDEGLENLDRVLAFEPANRDAMSFESLLLREKARLTANPTEQARLLALADEWFDKASIRAGAGAGTGAGPAAPPMPPQTAEVLRLPVLARSAEPSRDPDAVRIGILHSLTGTMAISETSLKDAVMMAVDEINAKGGVLGKRIEPIVVDPASDWPLFAQKAKQLLSQDKVAAVFGCWTSVSRKSVLPVFESLHGLLFYPLQFEGEEQSPNIFYTGPVPNQQLIPAAQFLISPQGGSKKKFYLLGTDYVFPRTANKILRGFLRSLGVPESNIVEEYTPFGHADYQTIVRKIKDFGRAGDAAVLSTINGDSNVPFFKEFANQGVTASQIPIMSFSVAEDELRSMETASLVGHLAAWTYFQSIDTPENKAYVGAFRQFAADKRLPGGTRRVTDDPIEASYSNVYLWKAAVEKAGSFDVDKVSAALNGLEIDTPAGKLRMHPENHHAVKSLYIGKVRADGQFEIVWKSDPIEPEAFSRFLGGERAPARFPGLVLPEIDTASWPKSKVDGRVTGIDQADARIVLTALAAAARFEAPLADGRFSFSSVPANVYRVTVKRGKDSLAVDPPFVVVGAQDRSGVEFTLPPMTGPLATPSAHPLSRSESSAIANLRTINTAEVTFLSSAGGMFGDLKQMIDAGLLDSRFQRTISGYQYMIIVQGGDYLAVAAPTNPEDGNFAFFSSPDGVVRFSTDEQLSSRPRGTTGAMSGNVRALIGAINGSLRSPLRARRGGCGINKKSSKYLIAAAGVVVKHSNLESSSHAVT